MEPQKHRPRRRALLRRLLAAAAGFVVAVLTAELALALLWTRPGDLVGSELADSGLFVPDPVCGWSMRPSYQVRHELPWGGEVTIATNADSLRDVAHDPADRRPRVLVLGDSFPFGFGVEAEQAFPRRLAAALPEVSVHNFGGTGFNTAQEHALLRARGAPLRPRAVVLAFCMNDVERQAVPSGRPRRHAAAPAAGLKGWLSRNSSIYELSRTFVAGNKPLSRWLVDLGLKESLPGYEALDTNLRPFLRESNAPIEQAWGSTLDELDAMHELCTSIEARLVVALVPARQSVEPDALTATLAYVDFEAQDFDFTRAYERVAAHCRARDIPCVDPTADFRAHIAAGEALYLPGDMHFNARGHELFAARLLPAVRAAAQ